MVFIIYMRIFFYYYAIVVALETERVKIKMFEIDQFFENVHLHTLFKKFYVLYFKIEIYCIAS